MNIDDTIEQARKVVGNIHDLQTFNEAESNVAAVDRTIYNAIYRSERLIEVARDVSEKQILSTSAIQEHFEAMDKNQDIIKDTLDQKGDSLVETSNELLALIDNIRNKFQISDD